MPLSQEENFLIDSLIVKSSRARIRFELARADLRRAAIWKRFAHPARDFVRFEKSCSWKKEGMKGAVFVLSHEVDLDGRRMLFAKAWEKCRFNGPAVLIDGQCQFAVIVPEPPCNECEILFLRK